uniref:Spliceosome associated factor 1, recruiter of U4/U6.U5 tri-snRNP n=1 Tax=Oncorhynchus mykiss TaxID=8022 RepID=A0A8C7UML9_ONCMY
MGSSKKHKEKGRDKDKDAEERGHREHKKHRHKDRERDKERDGNREREKRKRSRSKERSVRGSERDGRSKGERSTGEPRVKKEKVEPGCEGTGKYIKLGTKEQPIVAETINPVYIKQQKEMREKLAALKEKRLLNKKLGKVKTLAEEDWLDDTVAWVERSRKMSKEKELAEKRAKLLQEMDEEFGVSNLVEEEFGQTKKVAYSSRDLKGLTVQHKMESFNEGETVILTLQDKGVLDEEGGDVLVNVGLVDKENAEKNVELKKKKPDYKAYEEDESVDDMCQLCFSLFLKYFYYDEEIDGEKKKSFRLSKGGCAEGERERELQAIRETLRNQAQSLEMPVLAIASEYYTPQEMVGFKKTKQRVRKIRKKEKALPDELQLDDTRNTDFGSRARGRGRKQLDEEGQEGVKERVIIPGLDVPQQSDDIRMADMDISDDENFTPPDPAVLEEDEAEQELQKQLEKQRKLKQKQLLKNSGEKVAEQVRGLARGDDSDDEDKNNLNIVFNATSEFCRTLGDIPTYGLSGNREDQEDIMDFEQEAERDGAGGSDSDGDENVGWSIVNVDEEQKQPDFATASTTILDEEPIVNSGLAAALALCKNKGLLDTQMQKISRVRAPTGALPNDNYSIEDKMTIDDKYSRREEYRGFTQDFKEKDAYKPDVKIEYVDESGRKLTPKEAFRQLSHRFHGKGSGKMKTERRMKKLEEEALLKKMSSSDTPLGTVALLQEKQKSQKTPYIVLSGSGKSMNANNITK